MERRLEGKNALITGGSRGISQPSASGGCEIVGRQRQVMHGLRVALAGERHVIDSEWVKILFRLFDRKVRLRLWGYRPEVICLVKAADKERFLITVPATNRAIWIPPQEGIALNETIEAAAHRCLEVEVGLTGQSVQFRRSTWVGKRRLPRERWGERDLEYSLRRIDQPHSMIGKGYYAALIFADDSVRLCPNAAEIHCCEWVSGEQFLARIGGNVPDKRQIIRVAWQRLVSAYATTKTPH